jgi:hypothetical protein
MKQQELIAEKKRRRLTTLQKIHTLIETVLGRKSPAPEGLHQGKGVDRDWFVRKGRYFLDQKGGPR